MFYVKLNAQNSGITWISHKYDNAVLMFRYDLRLLYAVWCELLGGPSFARGRSFSLFTEYEQVYLTQRPTFASLRSLLNQTVHKISINGAINNI